MIPVRKETHHVNLTSLWVLSSCGAGSRVQAELRGLAELGVEFSMQRCELLSIHRAEYKRRVAKRVRAQKSTCRFPTGPW